MTPLFSVIVPVYKAEPYLRQCVDSILEQSCPDFELILVDDGSPDGCGAICDQYTGQDERITVIHQENAGPVAARRNGLLRAQAEYVCFVDSDDWLVPHCLETIRGYIDANGRPDVIVHNYVRDTGETDWPVLAEPGYYDKARLEREIYPYMLLDRRRRPYGTQLVPGVLCSKAIKRELVSAHYLTDDRITVFEDTAMIYDVLYHAASAYMTDEKLYVYRRLDQSNLNHYRPDFFREIRFSFDYMSATLGGKMPELDRQLNGYFSRRVIAGIVWEHYRGGSIASVTKTVAGKLKESGLVRCLSLAGMPLYMQAFVLLLKCRLYYPAVLLVKWRM